MNLVQLRVEKTKMAAFADAVFQIGGTYEITSETEFDKIVAVSYEYPHQLFYLGKITEINVRILDLKLKQVLS